jgi:hypothetical protein
MGGLLPIFVGVADFNRPKGRGIKPHGRIKNIIRVGIARTRVAGALRNSAEYSRITGLVWNLLHGLGFAADKDIDSASL